MGRIKNGLLYGAGTGAVLWFAVPPMMDSMMSDESEQRRMITDCADELKDQEEKSPTVPSGCGNFFFDYIEIVTVTYENGVSNKETKTTYNLPNRGEFLNDMENSIYTDKEQDARNRRIRNMLAPMMAVLTGLMGALTHIPNQEQGKDSPTQLK